MSTDGPITHELEGIAVGEEFTTRGRTITEPDVVSFAALTGDWHPQHGDAAWAEASRFGRRVAHGMLVLSYALGLVALDPERVVALRRAADVVFKRPVFIGDTIHVEGRVAEVRPVDAETGLVALQWKIVNQDGATAVRATIEALWRGLGSVAGDGSRPAPQPSRAPDPVRREVYL